MTLSEHCPHCVIEIGDCQWSRCINSKDSPGEQHRASLSHCPWHILFTASAPGNALIQRQVRAFKYCNGPLLASALPVCTEGSFFHEGADGCWWAKPVNTDVARGWEKPASQLGSVWTIKRPFISSRLSLLFPVHATFHVPGVPWPVSSSSYRLKCLWHSSKINSWIHNRRLCSGVPWGKCFAEKVMSSHAPPHTHLPFDLAVFTCGLLIPRQTRYGTLGFEIGLVPQ